MNLALLIGGIFVVNLPFGYWRAGVRKLSPTWFVAVHAAVPIVIVMRQSLGIEWSLQILPVMVAAYFAGQTVGGRVRRARSGARLSR